MDTTLGYARLYDDTLAAHCYRAMGEVEKCVELVRSLRASPFTNGSQLLALVDGLGAGTLEFAW